MIEIFDFFIFFERGIFPSGKPEGNMPLSYPPNNKILLFKTSNAVSVTFGADFKKDIRTMKFKFYIMSRS